MRAQQLAKRADIQISMLRSKAGQVLFRQLKQPDGRSQTAAVLGMRRVLEIFLQMHKRAGGLNQTFEKIGIIRIGLEPKLLENVVCFVIMLLVPALKIGPVKGMARDVDLGYIDIFSQKLPDQLRNPLAFVHEEPNLIAAQTMGKPARSISPEDERARHRARGKE